MKTHVIENKQSNKKILTSHKKPRPKALIDFNFNALTMPLTKEVLDLEAERVKSFFKKKPPVLLMDLSSNMKQSRKTSDLEQKLSVCTGFYRKDSEVFFKVLEVIGLLFLEAASHEKQDAGYQQYLIYQSLDFLSLSVQHAPQCLNISAERMMLNIHRVLRDPLGENIGSQIVHQMEKILSKPQDLQSIEVRDQIIRLCLKGHRYYDALYHIQEYERVMKLKSRSMYLIKSGEIQYRKAHVFQQIIDFYVGVFLNKKERAEIRDMAKLQSFIRRLNMHESNISVENVSDTLSVHKALVSLINIANNHYQEATNDLKFVYKHRAYYGMAHNYVFLDKPGQAVTSLKSGLKEVDKARLYMLEKMKEKLVLVEYMVHVFTDHGQPQQAADYKNNANQIRKMIFDLDQKNKKEKAVRAAV
ncbi:MAG: hypothetical protein HQM12_01100 [SAR324 cluster bacterium]|nr:hypothetical protein [SAR324 cluster bacterium]